MAKKPPRKEVKILAVYHHDAAFLARLADAVTRDDAMPDEWKRVTVGLLQQVRLMFENAESVKKK